jgi:hypothetical protein
MKLFSLLVITLILNITTDKCQAQSKADSLTVKVNRLKQLYLLSTSSSQDNADIYKQQFFNAFPNTFKELNEIYGYETNKPSPLYFEVEHHIYELFNNLNNINDTLYYRKIISIAIGGRWDADAINIFQEGLRNRILNNPELAFYILKRMPDDKISSFWYFYFDTIHPKKEIPGVLLKTQNVNKHIYDLMIEAQKQVLKTPE